MLGALIWLTPHLFRLAFGRRDEVRWRVTKQRGLSTRVILSVVVVIVVLAAIGT